MLSEANWVENCNNNKYKNASLEIIFTHFVYA